MTETLQLCQCPGPTGRHVWVRPLRQAAGSPNEMRHARLPGLDPPLIHPIPITDQDPLPVVDEGGEGFFGAPRMDHIESYSLTGHHEILIPLFAAAVLAEAAAPATAAGRER